MPWKDPEQAKLHKKEYRKRTIAHIKKYRKEYRLKNGEKLRAKAREYYQEHKDQIIARAAEWLENNRERANKSMIASYGKRLKVDPKLQLKNRIRSRIKKAIKGNYKKGSALQELGCSIEFLKDHIASKFYDGMSWSNSGLVWELDHIVPLANFDLTDPAQFRTAVHYTNLQPLTIKDHRLKTKFERKERL